MAHGLSGVHYVHPDKRPQMFINEVAVAPTHQGRGIGKSLLCVLNDRARQLGCTESWVLTDQQNVAAMRMYAGAGGSPEPASSLMFTFFLGPS